MYGVSTAGTAAIESLLQLCGQSYSQSCSSSNSGGGIYSEGGDVSLTNTTMSGNSGYLGGAIAVQDCSVSLVNSTVVGNKATAAGGGDRSHHCIVSGVGVIGAGIHRGAKYRGRQG